MCQLRLLFNLSKMAQATTLSTTYTDYHKLGIEPPFVSIFVAPRKSGKTFLINKLIQNVWAKQFEYIVIASPTLEFVDDYPVEQYVEDKSKLLKVHEGLETTLKRLIEDQKRTQLLHKENPDEYDEVSTLLILDDIIDSKLMKWGSTNNITDLIAERGRHFNLSLVLTSQFLSAISPSVRRNAETLTMFAPINFAEVDRTLQEYVPTQWRFEFQERLADMFRERFAFLIIDGSVGRRTDFRMRLRKGFSELMFELNEEDKDALYIKPRMRKHATKSNKSAKSTKREVSDTDEV